MMDKLSVDQVEEAHGTAFVKALVMDLRRRREMVVVRLSEVGWGSADAASVHARCGRLAAYDEVLALVLETKGKETET